MATYYVSPTTASPAGNNANAGTIGAPWATLSYAITQVTTAGDLIYVNSGTYPAITTQMLLANRVSIQGAGRTLVTIPMTYSAGTPCIKLETWAGWENKSTVGHQSISGIKFVGSTTPGTPVGQKAIGVNFRNSVEIYDCEFVDFLYTAVSFLGEPTYNLSTIDNPYETRVGEDSQYLPNADSFCTGNKFYDNLVSNSCGLVSGTSYSGELEAATQDGLLVYGNTMTALGRAGRGNGVPIKLIGDVGFNRNVKIYNNNIDAGDKDTNYWQFAMEIWWDLGGLEIYDNVMHGSIDLCHQWDQYGVGFGAKVYGNDIGYDSAPVSSYLNYGIRLEDQHISCYIYRNKIHHVAVAIDVNNANRNGAEVWDGVYIYDNLMVELSGNAYQTWGILQQSSIVNHAAVWRNCYIQHNVIQAATGAPNPTYYGIMLPTVEDFDGLYIENNILINWERGAIYGSGTRVQATNFFIRNNLIYDSYNSNDPVYVSSYPTAGITYSGTVKSDPSFLGSGDDPYQLSSTSSPAYHAGRDLDIATDYLGASFHATTPSIGAYEITAATAYYVKNGGNDSLDGLSDANAWATIAKVNSMTLAAGSSVLFKRGDVWREEVSLVPDSGSSSDYITYGAYGTGAKPKLLGSVIENEDSDWTHIGGNVWTNSDASFSVNVGNLIFNNEASYGVYKSTLVEVTAQGDFFFNVSTNVLYLYSASNPGTFYSNIECALDRHIVDFGNSKSYIILEDLDIRYGAGHGVSGYSGCSYITVQDCDFSFIGGGYFEDGAARYGNAIQFWQNSSYITVERCTFDNIYDAAITGQYAGSGSETCNINNWQVRHNLINRSEYSWEFFTHDCVGTLSGIYFQNNTCRNAGGGFGHDQRPDSQNGRHVMVSGLDATTRSNIWVRNNIFDTATESAIHIATEAEAYISFDYNLYNVTTVAYNGDTYASLASWQGYRSDENNSISGNPALVSSSDWHLTASSPAIGEGYNTGYATDFDLISWAVPYDIGAYKLFTTPSLTTTTQSSVTSVSAVSGGNISDDGGSAVTARGVCWNTSGTPTTSDSVTTNGTGTGSFSSDITGLSRSTLYYVRAYATNSAGTSYGSQISFTTLNIAPTVTTTAITSITTTSAASGGNVTSDGGATVTARGVCWSTGLNPTISSSKTTDGSGTGSFASAISGLSPGITYHVRAYATNSIGTSYGADVSFVTTTTTPTVSTTAITDITSISATSGGNATADGGLTITARGVCWSTSSNPTTADSKTTNGTGTGSFVSSITGLTAGLTYHVRAYATNPNGTSYGTDISFSTSDVSPIVTTDAVTGVTTSGATCGGNVTADGGDTVTARGVCWSTSPSPVASGSHTTDGSGTGAFVSTISGLSDNTLYYVRAYATNGIGTSYGTQITFITNTIGTPVLTTTAATDIAITTATSGGNISSDGGASVTARGLCWSTSQNPTIADTHTSNGTGTGSFVSYITGLSAGVTYYIRAYATNSAGTAYGDNLSFVTLTVYPALTTTAITAVTKVSALSGGNITSDGGDPILERGVCWSTTIDPTISDSHTSNGYGSGVFSSSITGLTEGTTYYVRAYATNSVGTSYGLNVAFSTLSDTLLSNFEQYLIIIRMAYSDYVTAASNDFAKKGTRTLLQRCKLTKVGYFTVYMQIMNAFDATSTQHVLTAAHMASARDYINYLTGLNEGIDFSLYY